MISQSLFNPQSRAYVNGSNILRSPLDLFNFNPFSADAQEILYQSQLTKRTNPYADQDIQLLASNIQKKLKTPETSWTPSSQFTTGRDFSERTINATGKQIPEVINLEDDSDDECVIIEDDPTPQVSEPLFVKDNVFSPILPENNLAFNQAQLISQMANLQRTFFENRAQSFVQKTLSPVIIIDEEDQWEQLGAKKNATESDFNGDAQTDSTLSPKGLKREVIHLQDNDHKKINHDISDSESDASYTPNQESQEATIPDLCNTRPTRETARRKPKQVWNPTDFDRDTLEQYYSDLCKLTRKDITNEEVAINTLKMCEMDVNKTLAIVKQNRAIYRDLFSTKRKHHHLL